MARVVKTDVTAIIKTSWTNINPFITAANLFVTEKLGDSDDLGDDDLKEIERWVAAHFIAVTQGMPASERVGDASATYQVGKLGAGLMSTQYGQMACTLDTTGTLLATANKRKPSMDVSGVESETTTT